MPTSTFYADAVLFDMDGTLTDSIAAVEAAWGRVALEVGEDPAFVISATHGKRALDNLSQFKPELLSHELDAEVSNFEESILFYADAYNKHGPGSKIARGDLQLPSPGWSPISSATPSAPQSRASSRVGSLPDMEARLSSILLKEALSENDSDDYLLISTSRSPEICAAILPAEDKSIDKMGLTAWQSEAATVDRSVRILPGVKDMIASIPEGRYAVVTSGAHTYAYGCMTRVGIIPPKVTITADDKRLKAGKPAPDPFLLAADCLGYSPARCVCFEDSPSGIRSAVASGAIVIAVCTSHDRSMIDDLGAHFVVNDMEDVQCESIVGSNAGLKFTVAW